MYVSTRIFCTKLLIRKPKQHCFNFRWIRGSINIELFQTSPTRIKFIERSSRRDCLFKWEWFVVSRIILDGRLRFFFYYFVSVERPSSRAQFTGQRGGLRCTCRERTAHTNIMTCIFLVAKKVSVSELCEVGACSRAVLFSFTQRHDATATTRQHFYVECKFHSWASCVTKYARCLVSFGKVNGYCVPMCVYAIKKRILVRITRWCFGAFIK